MQNIKFGTDGWRALMDTDFTFENVELVAQAFADYMNAEQKKKGKSAAPRIAIGFDYRKNSENFAKTVADVLTANGLDVLLSSAACPTPAVSYAIVRDKLDSGIMITASHNPPGYNGIKIKNDFGGSAEKTITDEVERSIGKNPVLKKGPGKGSQKLVNLHDAYLEYLKSYIRLDAIKNSPYRILVDSMHGVGARNIEDIT
ncbi:MAG TPA: phosphoglucomutase/phosphomannomutase family protein, partial [Candidatus Omnitrophota bacterium]|nr:phosphoglucomutase/phosphomannomutase family protein [Candidatus Omnitrophota bacterium]